jgi:hypothetical protein
MNSGDVSPNVFNALYAFIIFLSKASVDMRPLDARLDLRLDLRTDLRFDDLRTDLRFDDLERFDLFDLFDLFERLERDPAGLPRRFPDLDLRVLTGLDLRLLDPAGLPRRFPDLRLLLDPTGLPRRFPDLDLRLGDLGSSSHGARLERFILRTPSFIILLNRYKKNKKNYNFINGQFSKE